MTTTSTGAPYLPVFCSYRWCCCYFIPLTDSSFCLAYLEMHSGYIACYTT
jgi:hypothetical protein